MNISEFMGKVFTKIEKPCDEELHFYTADKHHIMYHEQDCCEGVEIEDICGDIADLENSPITMAEEVTDSKHFPEDSKKKRTDWTDSFTWTFYKLATIKGYVTIR